MPFCRHFGYRRIKEPYVGKHPMIKQFFLLLIRGYQQLISPLFPPVCRFQPTCSQYALEAVDRFGVVKGSWLAMRRITKCHPFHPGGYDPVPPVSDQQDSSTS